MAVTNYIWDESSDNVLLETDNNDTVTASYINRPEPFGSVFEQTRIGATSHYHFDGQGNTRQLTDDNQDVTDSYTFSAFGEEVASSGSTENPFKYGGIAGYYTNDLSRTMSVRARNYEPIIGRWLSKDPVGFDGNDTNLFRYVGNNPINVVDPSGLAWSKTLRWQCGVVGIGKCRGRCQLWGPLPSAIMTANLRFALVGCCVAMCGLYHNKPNKLDAKMAECIEFAHTSSLTPGQIWLYRLNTLTAFCFGWKAF